jgi:FlaA1/EpsC-like NDP-sugar epimerase
MSSDCQAVRGARKSVLDDGRPLKRARAQRVAHGRQFEYARPSGLCGLLCENCPAENSTGSRRLHPRNIAALAHDVIAAGIAWCLAYWLRFNFEIPPFFADAMVKTLGPALLAQAGIFVLFGLYRGLWRYASLVDLQRILLAVGVAALALPSLTLLLEARGLVPRSVFFLDPVLLVFLMGGSRFGYRAWKEHQLYGKSVLRGEPVIVMGAGEAGAALVRDLQRSERYRVVALFDDLPSLRGQVVHGVRVVGAIGEVGGYAGRAEVRRAIVAMPSATPAVRRRAVEAAQQASLDVMTVPALEDLVSGRIAISQVRNVELEDLLGRQQVELDSAAIEGMIAGRTVLVTGAGGSIGSELCRQIARRRPGRLVLFESNEYALYQIVEEFAAGRDMPAVTPVIGDVKDEGRVRAVFARYKPSIVFHAAAYKHVPLMEEENAWQAVRNNVLGTYVVAAAARAIDTGKFVLVSTDKAVNPANVMGATKRLAEMVCQSLSAGPCRFVTVRFGNVLGSAGSVIPKFKEQIARGGPVTVTHPEIERYFMSIPEAAQLVLQAGCMGEGGEIFVLDMGEPIKIAVLARDMIRLSGLGEDDVKIVFTGLRPGEKLYEELLADDERTAPTRHTKIRIAVQREGEGEGWCARLLGEIGEAGQPDEAAAREWLARWVREYSPQGAEEQRPAPVS